MQTTRRSPFRTAVALTTCWALVLTNVMQTALAATTALADTPIAAKVAAKPNIVYTVDESGSMNYTFLPDFVTGSYCRSGNNIAACGAIALFNSTFYWPPVLAPQFNHLAYDSNINYTPPLAYDGNPKTYQVGTVTDAQGNQVRTLPAEQLSRERIVTLRVGDRRCRSGRPTQVSGLSSARRRSTTSRTR